MNEEAAKRDDHQPARELQQRYEAMLKARQSWYFDIDQFEQIVDLYFDQGRVRKALSVIHYARTIFPDAFILRLRQAQLLAGMGELNRALELLRALEEVEPTNDEILLTLGTVFSQLRDHRNAVRYYERALRFGQVELQNEVYIDLALEYENMERFNEAIRVLDRALRQNPENDTAVYEIAYCFEMAGRFEDARAYYVQFLDDYPYSFATWYNLGNSYFRTAEYHKAADAFEYCLAIEDQFAPGWYNLANTLVFLEDFNRAIECYKETMELETPQAGVYCLVGECYEKLEQLKEADFYYNLALKLDPKNVDAIIGKAVVNDLQGHSEKAIELLREADGLEPNNPDIMLMMAEAQKNVGNVSSAREIYLRAIEAHPKCVQAWLDYAHFRFDLNHVDGAENLIEQALGENPDNTSLLLRKVAYLHALGKQKQALLLLDYLHQSENNDFDELTDYYPEILNDADARELCKSPEES